MVSSAHVMHWKVHFRKTIPMLVDAYQNRWKSETLNLLAMLHIMHVIARFFVGEELTKLEQKRQPTNKAIRQIRKTL